MSNLLDKWNKNNFSIYKSEEKTVLELLESMNNFNKDVIKEIDNKTDLFGDHKGSWQGIAYPTLSEEGLRGTVENNVSRISNLETSVDRRKGEIKFYYLSDICNAIGDGVTDDTEEIQKAFDYVHEQKGTLIFPCNKTFKTTYSLLIDSFVTIEGNNSIIDYGLENGVEGSAIVTKSFTGGEICTNIVIKNLGFKASSTYKNALGICRASNVIIDSVFGNEVYYHLVDFANVQESIIKNVRGAYYERALIQIDNLTALGGLTYESIEHLPIQAPIDTVFNSENVTIENCYGYECSDFIHLHRQGGSNITINNNTAINCGSLVKGDKYTKWVNVYISNNNCVGDDKNTSYGIYTEGYISNLKVLNNNFQNIKYGVNLKSWSSYNAGSNSYVEKNNNVTIANNTFTNIGDRALTVDVALNVNINNNNLLNIGTSDSQTKWDLNTAYNYQGSRAIGLFKCTNSTVTGNIIENCYGTGIMLQGKCDITVISNNVVSNSFVCFSASQTNSSYTETTDYHLTISSNELWGGVINQINIELVDNEWVKIKDNSLTKTGYRGIYLKNVSNLWIFDNVLKAKTLETGTGIGIDILNNTNAYIKDNFIEGFLGQDIRETNNTNVNKVNSFA